MYEEGSFCRCGPAHLVCMRGEISKANETFLLLTEKALHIICVSGHQEIEDKRVKNRAPCEGQTHGLRIMRLTRCLLANEA